jgi:hypothetical protein
MAVSRIKKPTTKSSVKKTAPAKKPAVKKAAPKKPVTKKTSTAKKRKISAEERYKMVEIAAYYIAEHNNFQGNAIDFWVTAEAGVSKQID